MALRRIVFPCFCPASPSGNAPSDDQDDEDRTPVQPSAPPRTSRTMVLGTIFGSRSPSGHVFFCVQQDRLSSKPLLLLELSVPTRYLVKEMRFGLVRVALESSRHEFRSLPLRSVPFWSMSINGRKAGSAYHKKPCHQTKSLLHTMRSITNGAGVIPNSFKNTDDDTDEITYMRASYEHVVGGADVESFHLINPEMWSGPGSECGQEFSLFLMRSY